MTTAQTLKVSARLPGGRLLIAYLDPRIPERHSPLQRALAAADIPLERRREPT